ncbi:hypothetical protein [Prolixibacter denitrificans]|nr:hypothetical protein [Prolixibacter denitrificans]
MSIRESGNYFRRSGTNKAMSGNYFGESGTNRTVSGTDYRLSGMVAWM